MDDWERKPLTDQTYFNLRPFIQAAYQRRITSGTVTASAGGYGSNNRFAGLSTEDDVSDDGTAKTIVESINNHMANLSASVMTQLSASNDANTTVFNAAIQQMAANEAQRNADHTRMMQQFAMMSTTTQTGIRSAAATQRQFVPSAIPVLGNTQQWAPPDTVGRGSSTRSRGGYRGRRTVRSGAPAPFAPSNAMIPYIPSGATQARIRNPRFSNVVKQFANQNVCFSCGFDVGDWHTSATALTGSKATKRVSLVQISKNTNEPITSSVARRCTRPCIRQLDG